MTLFSFFSNAGTPATGLSATIDIWNEAGLQIVTAGAMTEVGGGFYKYYFTGYVEDRDYCIRADGSATLSGSDRYTYMTNEVGQVTEDLTDIASDVTDIQSDILRGVEEQQIDEIKILVQGLYTELQKLNG